MKYLFVGGSWDGKRQEVDITYLGPIQVPVLQDVEGPVHQFDRFTEYGPTIRIEWYEPAWIAGDKAKFKVYRIEGMNPDQMIKSLIDHYHPEISQG